MHHYANFYPKYTKRGQYRSSLNITEVNFTEIDWTLNSHKSTGLCKFYNKLSNELYGRRPLLKSISHRYESLRLETF